MVLYALLGLLSLCSLHAMEENSQTIKLHTLKDYLTYSYTKETTIETIKMKAQLDTGLPPHLQKMVAVVPTSGLMKLWSAATHSDDLCDDATVQEVVENYGTHNFALFLKILPKI